VGIESIEKDIEEDIEVDTVEKKLLQEVEHT